MFHRGDIRKYDTTIMADDDIVMRRKPRHITYSVRSIFFALDSSAYGRALELDTRHHSVFIDYRYMVPGTYYTRDASYLLRCRLDWRNRLWI